MGAQANHRREDVVLSLAKETLRSFGEFRFVAWGSSMLPSVFPGDTLIVRHETAETAPVGVIVLLARQGRLYAHRLVDKTQESGQLRLIVRGDALSSDDPPFAEDEVLGRVTAVIRRGRRIDLDGKSPAATERLLQWMVRRSESSAKWLLRWHSLRARLSPAPASARDDIRREAA
ncbi:MAG: S24/S26 family peptidase [Candidatus Acidiferrales bacterium]